MHKHNSLSEAELIALETTLLVMDTPEYQCEVCLKRYEGRENGEELLNKWRTLKGCFGSANPVRQLGNYRYSNCPGNIFDRSAIFITNLYKEYQKGILPFKGCLTEQPAKIIECFDVIEAFSYKKIEEQKNKDKLRTQRNGPAVRRNIKPRR